MKFHKDGYLEYRSRGTDMRIWSSGKLQWSPFPGIWNTTHHNTCHIYGITVDSKTLYRFLRKQYMKQ